MFRGSKSSNSIKLVDALDQEGLVKKKKEKNIEKKPPTELSIPNSPDQTKNSDINTIGQRYYDLFGEDPKRRHKSHPIAKEIMEYNLDNASDDKLRFLVKQYRALSKYSDNYGQLITMIRTFFEKLFNQTIPLEKDSKELSVEEVAKYIENMINAFFAIDYKNKYETVLTELQQYKNVEQPKKLGFSL